MQPIAMIMHSLAISKVRVATDRFRSAKFEKQKADMIKISLEDCQKDSQVSENNK